MEKLSTTQVYNTRCHSIWNEFVTTKQRPNIRKGVRCLRSIFLRPTPFLNIKADRKGGGVRRPNFKQAINADNFNGN